MSPGSTPGPQRMKGAARAYWQRQGRFWARSVSGVCDSASVRQSVCRFVGLVRRQRCYVLSEGERVLYCMVEEK